MYEEGIKINKKENGVLLKVAENIGFLKASHIESQNDIKEIKQALIPLAEKVQKNEIRSKNNSNTLKNLTWFVGKVASLISIGTTAVVSLIFYLVDKIRLKGG
jgi:hypothetical protein